jgi:hypothetical protein
VLNQKKLGESNSSPSSLKTVHKPASEKEPPHFCYLDHFLVWKRQVEQCQLSTTEEGFLRALQIEMHCRRGPVAFNGAELARVFRCGNTRAVAYAKKLVAKGAAIVRNGYLIHEATEVILRERGVLSKVRADAGRKGGMARPSHIKHLAEILELRGQGLSTRKISVVLKERGIDVSDRTVGRMLTQHRASKTPAPQANASAAASSNCVTPCVTTPATRPVTHPSDAPDAPRVTQDNPLKNHTASQANAEDAPRSIYIEDMEFISFDSVSDRGIDESLLGITMEMDEIDLRDDDDLLADAGAPVWVIQRQPGPVSVDNAEPQEAPSPPPSKSHLYPDHLTDEQVREMHCTARVRAAEAYQYENEYI